MWWLLPVRLQNEDEKKWLIEKKEKPITQKTVAIKKNQC